MKLKLDENLPADLASLLRERGHDAAGAVEEGLGGSPDQQLLQVANSEGRILMTYDLEIADVRRFPAGQHAGLVVFRLDDQR